MNGHTDVAKLLLEKGADVNATGTRQIQVDERDADMLSVDKDSWTPLYPASLWGRTEIVKLLLEKGADVNITGAGCKFETGYDADVPIVDRNSLTALQLASKRGHTEIMRLLEIARDQNSGDSPGAEISDK
jgi:ankyrin repeat protein